MRKYISSALKILTKVFSDGTYSNIAFYGESVSEMTTRLVYGVLEQNVKLEYIIDSLTSRKPQNKVYVLLKIGAYALLYLDDVPDFAIVSECVEVAKADGKGGASGFVNAILKNIAKGKYVLPNETAKDHLSVTYSKPQWFVDKLISQYGEQTAKQIISAQPTGLEHIRINRRLSSFEEVASQIEKSQIPYRASETGGIITRVSDVTRKLFEEGKITIQSPSSMLAVEALGARDGANILDVCSAPGGKAVYLSELCPNSAITACDIHKHRIGLIQKYKQRMHAPNIKAVINDASVFNSEWENAFDFVLADVPCSCFGTFTKHADVFLSRGEKDIAAIAQTQLKIAKNAARYLKKGGVMVYSTCTLFKEENDDIVAKLISECGLSLDKIATPLYPDNDGSIQVLPHGEWDGFYIARLIKK